MNVILISTCYWIVRAFIACCVTSWCLARVGRDCDVVGGVGFPAPILVDMRLVESSHWCIRVGDRMHYVDCWQFPWCIVPSRSCVDSWCRLQSLFGSRVACLHDRRRIGDAGYGNDW